MEKHVLFTNISNASIGDLQLEVSAVLLSLRQGALGQQQINLAGFGPDPAWLVFHKPVKTLEHQLIQVEVENRKTAMWDLVVGDFAIRVLTDDWDKPVKVEAFEGGITDVWDELQKRIVRFWKAPNIPSLSWRRTEDARHSASISDPPRWKR